MEFDDEEMNRLLVTEMASGVNFTLTNSTINSTAPQLPQINVTTTITTDATVGLVEDATLTNATSISSSVLPSLSSGIKFLNENVKICEIVTQTIQDLTRDLDPLAALLIVVALVIAIVGAIAIVCQCQMWRKSKRQR